MLFRIPSKVFSRLCAKKNNFSLLHSDIFIHEHKKHEHFFTTQSLTVQFKILVNLVDKVAMTLQTLQKCFPLVLPNGQKQNSYVY